MHRHRVPLIAALLLGIAITFPLGVLASHQFTDVPDSNTFHDDIDAIYDVGVTTGCGVNLYCPKAFVTREQMAAFLNRLGALEAGKTPVVNAATALTANSADTATTASSADDAGLLDGIDSSGFVQGRGGWTYRQPLTITQDLVYTDFFTPFGRLSLACRFSESGARYDFWNPNGGPVTIDVFEELGGGATTFFSLADGASTITYDVPGTNRRTWEMTDGTDSMEIDIWSRWIGGGCQYILSMSFGEGP